MGIISRAADTYYTYRFLKHLVTPWNKMKAFELGLIDKDGKRLRSPETPEEKSEYSYFHRLIFNLKRILNKLPFGKSRLASYAAALFLLKEDGKLNDEQLEKVLSQMEIDPDEFLPEEKRWHQDDDGNLFPGEYTLTQDVASPLTGEPIAKERTKVIVNEGLKPVDHIFGEPIFKVHHISTKQQIYVSLEDITR
tara:strand:+ start:2185 stop:2766 length:582 start_codon:yes stop_codon:yes gene_type:complete